MNKTTRIDIENRLYEHRIYTAQRKGREIHIECPFCGEQCVTLFDDLVSHDVNCRCGVLLTWWYAAYQKKRYHI